jgi:hypothetical protein
MPGFSADASLGGSRGQYRAGARGPGSGSIVPAIPFCGNCDYILDRCARNGYKPTAVCAACDSGNCYSGVEDPTPSDPWTPHPLDTFPGFRRW